MSGRPGSMTTATPHITEFLRDIRLAFGEGEVIRSADLVAKLIAAPARPWAEYKRGKPITQRQLARLLGGLRIISTNVRPPAPRPQGKGYRRIDFEEAWAAYCPVGDGSKNVDLSHSHAGWDAGTDRKTENGSTGQPAVPPMTKDEFIKASIRNCRVLAREAYAEAKVSLLGLQPTELLAPPIIRHLADTDLADRFHHVLASGLYRILAITVLLDG